MSRPQVDDAAEWSATSDGQGSEVRIVSEHDAPPRESGSQNSRVRTAKQPGLVDGNDVESPLSQARDENGVNVFVGENALFLEGQWATSTSRMLSLRKTPAA